MRKQIILLMMDSTRKDMLGCYGIDERMSTPNLDRMAAEGIRYENAYSCQPVCGPARSAIFTGTFPHSNGMVTNSMPLGDNVKTVGQRLTDAGIHCGYIGKWHLDGGDYFGLGRCPEGWDENYWYDMKCYLEEMSPEDRMRSRKWATSFDEDMTEEFTYAHKCTDKAVDFLKKFHDEDFFLTVSYDEPHGPSLCPAPFNTMYENFQMKDHPGYYDTLEGKPLFQKLWAGEKLNKPDEELNPTLGKPMQLFLGSNSFVDYEIGRILDCIDELMPDALVIFTSDHGEMLGAHRLSAKGAIVYREVANVPFIIRGGAKGAVCEYPASHIDLVPTIMDYMNLPIPKLLEGKSMMPQIKDPSVRINDEVYVEFTRYEVDHDGFGGLQMMRAIVADDMKLAVHLLDTDELYDMNDEYEVNNLIDDPEYAARRNELHDKILEHMNQTRDMFRGYQWACRSWRPEKVARWANEGYTRQRENEEYEPRQMDYDTGLPMVESVRIKGPGLLKAKN